MEVGRKNKSAEFLPYRLLAHSLNHFFALMAFQGEKNMIHSDLQKSVKDRKLQVI